ncbi:MAG: filamentous hemagglutinin family protein [Betaproteobacteria bacterium]
MNSDATRRAGRAGLVKRRLWDKFEPRARAWGSISVMAAAGVLTLSSTGPAQAQARPVLPTACTGGTCGGIARPFLGTASSTAIYNPNYAANTGRVTQTSQQAVLNWKDFNVASGYTMEFKNANYANGTWSTLNRIWQADPAVIAGTLRSDGQLYLLNQNGIVFSGGSRIDTSMLIASTLNISDDKYLNGILTAHKNGGGALSTVSTAATFSPFTGTDIIASSNAAAANQVTVENNAIISAAGGKVMLFAPNVTNNGIIQTPDGQTILAAGQKVYLAGSTSANLRGLLVEVDSGGTVTNNGSIVTDRGNTTLVGAAVNQNGLISAKTAVSANGSIRLLGRSGAADTNVSSTGDIALNATVGGTVTLGPGSVTEVRPDLADAATIDGSAGFLQSQVTVSAQKILHQGSINAPGGAVSLTALANPSVADTSDLATRPGMTYNAADRVFLDAGSSISVAGTTEVLLPMSRNLVEVQLRGNELRDDPLQRDGFLRGKTVFIDVNKGTTLADVSGYISAIPRTVAEKTLAGGSINIVTDGAVIMKSGATADVSGGKTTYQNGSLQPTKLFSGGKVYDIATAPVDLVYDRIFNGSYSVIDRKWGVTSTYESTSMQQLTPGFVQGANAGSISIRANGLVIDGTLTGTAVAGPYQRGAGKVTRGGTFTLLDFFGQGSAVGTDIRHDVMFQSGATASGIGAAGSPLTDPLATTAALNLSTDMLANGGFSTVSIDRHGKITLPGGVALRITPGSTELDATGRETDASRLGVSLTGSEIQIAGSILAPSRDVKLTTDLSATVGSPGGTPGKLAIDAGAGISTRGLWVNDRLAAGGGQVAVEPLLLNAGTVSLKADPLSQLSVGAATLDLTGGGWVSTKGKLTPGNGGGLSLTSSSVPALNADIRARSPGGSGGAFSVNVSYQAADRLGASVVLKNADSGMPLIANGNDPLQLGVSADAMSSLGFGSYSVTSNAPTFKIAEGTSVNLVAPYLQPDQGYALKPTGSDLLSFSSAQTSTLLRKPVSLTLTQNGLSADAIRIGAGSVIKADPLASISLSGRGSLDVEGSIAAPGGTISLSTKALSTEVDYRDNQYIWLGPNASLDVAGVAVNQRMVKGYRKGDVLDGGSINIQADRGYIVASAGSSINASGGMSSFDLPRGIAGAIVASTVGSNGGAINLTAAEGMLLDGSLTAKGGDAAGASGGALSLTLNTRNRADGAVSSNPAANPTTAFPVSTRSVVLRDGEASSIPDTLSFGGNVGMTRNGKALLNAAKVAQGGFERLSLTALAAQAQDPAPTAVTGDLVNVPAEVRVQGNVALGLRQSLNLNAPVLAVSGQSTLGAAYVQLGNSESDPLYLAALPAASAGAGTSLTINAGMVNADGRFRSADPSGMVDILGRSVVQGTDTVSLNANGDIRARSVLVQNADGVTYSAKGDFSVAKDLTLTAQQIYPGSYSNFSFNSAGGTIATMGVTGAAGAVLSAGGAITLNAPTIDHGGVLKAPIGTVTLNGTGPAGSIVLEPGSLVSVSADGRTIPYGSTENKTDWVYGLTAADGTSFKVAVMTPPEKQVKVNAGSVTVKSSAVINVSGGGDLLAYEFVPGTGGSADILATTKTVNGQTVQNTEYAVLPWLNSAFAPVDPAIYTGSTLKPGTSVYLSGGAGLAAGTYALMPARYALLPGSYLVKSVSGYQDMRSGLAASQRDGSIITAGYLTNAGTASDGRRYSGFSIRPGTAALTQSEFVQSSANSFFTTDAATTAAADAKTVVGRLPQDAGSLSFKSNSLVLQGSLASAHSEASRGSEVDISADNIRVVGAAVNPALTGVLQLRAGELSQFGAESLLLGGTRSSGGNADTIFVGASSVTVANDKDNPLTGPEVILAAKANVTVAANAAVRGEGQFKGRARDIVIGSNDVVDSAGNVTQVGVSGQGALLSVSSTGSTTLTRNKIGDRSAGVLNIGADAVLKAEGFLRLDATNSTSIDVANNSPGVVSLDVARGGAMALSAGNITFGDTSTVTTGLRIPNTFLRTFADLGSLELRSYGSIDFRGPVTFGDTNAQTGERSLKDLRLETGSVFGSNGSNAAVGDVTIVAQRFSLSNPTGTSSTVTPGGTGTFSVSADTISLGSGNTDFKGFGLVKLASSGELVGSGIGSVSTSGALGLVAARITGDKGAGESVTAAGAVTIRQAAAAIDPVYGRGLGASWSISGASIDDSGVFELPAGQLALSATGVGGNVVVSRDPTGRASSANLAGYKKNFDGVASFAAGGTLTLNSDKGDVQVSDGSVLAVGASGAGGNAGTLNLSAPQGTVYVQTADAGALKAVALSGGGNEGFTGARINIDGALLKGAATDTANNFNAFNDLMNSGGFSGAAGFTGSRSIRARSGNLVVDGIGTYRSDTPGSYSVKADAIQLAADAGNITINGTLDASGPAGGQIALSTRANGTLANTGVLTLAATAQLDAAGKKAKGGDVQLSSDAGSIDVNTGASIKVGGDPGLVNGAETAGNGSVVMRAPRTNNGNGVETGVAISATSLSGITGAASVVVEGVKVYSDIGTISGSGADMAATAATAGTLSLAAGQALANNVAVFNSNETNNKAFFIGRSGVTDALLHVRPGIEIRNRRVPNAGGVATNSGDLTLAADWNLQGAAGSTWRSAGGEPIMLTLRAQGNLNLKGGAVTGFNSAVLNDAFDSAAVSTQDPATGALTTVGKLVGGESASYRLVGGADLFAAGALSVLTNSQRKDQLASGQGDVVLSPNKVVRTGNGDIAIAAGRNVELGWDGLLNADGSKTNKNKDSAAVYTAGQPTATSDYAVLNGFKQPGTTGSPGITNGVIANFGKNGGDIAITAGGNVNGAATSQLVTEWQQRIGLNNTDGTIRNLPTAGNATRAGAYNTAWWIDYGKFRDNVGALGGGNVSVRAGGNVDNLSVVIPTTGRLGGVTAANNTSTGANGKPDAGNLVVLGGGNLGVEAGGDIASGLFYTGRGSASLAAGGSIRAGRTVADTNPNASAADKLLAVGTILAVGEGQVSAAGGRDVTIETVLNPTAVLQDVAYASSANPTRKSIFYTYGADSAAQVSSTSGNVTFSNNTTALKQSSAPVQANSTGLPYVTATGFSYTANADNAENALTVYPSKLTAAALQGDMQVLNPFTLFPSSKGSLNLFAKGSVSFTSAAGNSVAVNLSDADPSLLVNPLYIPITSTASAATMSYVDTNNRLSMSTDTTKANSLIHKSGSPLHATDTTGPAEIVADTGSISGGNLFFAKPVRMVAGQDIKDIQVQAQNLSVADVTLLSAGRDVKFKTLRDALGNSTTNSNGVYVAGPGALEVNAGGNVSLGNATGLVTGGNVTNLALASNGARISVGVGVAPVLNYVGFIDKYFAATATSSYFSVLSDYLTGIGKTVSGLSDGQKLAMFKTLSVQLQAPLVEQVFFSELRDSGRAFATQGTSAYQRGTDAINALYPQGGQYRGNLRMLFSQIRTKAGGAIDLLVPGGEVNVGQTTQVKDSNAKSADKLGIVAEGTGGVFSYSKGDFNVNESKVFTLKGGDILIWSNEGDIDAGKGAKTASSSPPPTVITNPDGTTRFQFSSVAGNGIRGILTDRTLKPGDVDLIAPRGVVDAGDAGIGSAGNITIAAVRVVGADNIQVGGTSSGVPATQASGFAGAGAVASLPADNRAADTIGRNAANTSAAGGNVASSFRPNLVSVEVFCLGADCRQ